MTEPTLSKTVIDALRCNLRGPLLSPDDTGYDEARRVWNGSIDRHPAAIAQCTGTADVISGIRFAADHDLAVAIRGGGHSFAGFGTCDDGLVLDLGLMKGIRIDPDARRAVAQGGVTWGDLDHETGAFGLATTGGLISTTGIGGLTLGGGIGWLMRKHGLACDNLIGADLVTADGQLVHANTDDNPEVFWALRGGGGNFGVVTALEYQLHPVANVYAGALLYPASGAGDVLACYAEWARDEPDEMCSLIEFATGPDADFVATAHRGQPVVAFVFCYCGPVADGEAAITRWRHVAPVIADLVETMPYPTMQSFFDADYPNGLWCYMKSHYLDQLSNEGIAALLAAGANRPGRSIIDIHHLEGAAARVAEEDTAFDQRQTRYAVLLGAISSDQTGFTECERWAQQHWSALEPHATGGAYGNFTTDSGDRAVRAAWAESTLDRLATLKRQYDPANRFHFNHNVHPATASKNCPTAPLA